MKKYFFALVAGLIPALATINAAKAQSFDYNEANGTDMAMLSNDAPITKAGTRNADLSGISTKAVKNFTKEYKSVAGETWDKSADGFRAKFTADGKATSIYYDTKGRWSGSLKTYSEDKMPKDVRAIVKQQYYDYNIYQVQEVETVDSNGTPTYVIYMEDKDTLKMLTIYDGNMQVWQEYNKQK